MQQDLGKRIRKLREDAHMSQAELARELQVSRQAVSRWESGSSVPDASIVSDLCRALGVKYESVREHLRRIRIGRRRGKRGREHTNRRRGSAERAKLRGDRRDQEQAGHVACRKEEEKQPQADIKCDRMVDVCRSGIVCVVQFVGARFAGTGDLERSHTLFFHRIRDQYRRRCAFAAGYNFSHCHYWCDSRIDMLGADSQGGEEQEVGEACPSSCLVFC